MKNTIIIILFLAVSVSSCKKEDFLDRFPPSSLSEPTYFKNENDLKLYANRFYSSLPFVQDGTGDNMSDNVVPATRNTFLAGTYTIPATATAASGWTWTNERAVNYFLARYYKADVPAAIKNQYAGEVRLFRAFFFWQKVKQFGDVPFFTKDLNEGSPELFDARTPHKAVMDSVLADLDFAVNNLPLPSSLLAADKGRLHKYAALAMKARICLWEGTYRKYQGLGDDAKYLREAANAAELIMNSGVYSLYSTGNPTKDYYNLFIQDDLSANKESILHKIYIKDVLMQNTVRQVGQSNNGFSKNFVRQYLMKDGLPTSSSTLYKGDDSLDAEAANRDARFAQTIATRGFTFVANADGTRDTISLPRLASSATSTGYQFAKYRSPDPVQINASQSTIDIFIFRYAETLLIDAEAKAELGEATQTVIDNTINKLRARVGMPNMVIASLVKDPQSDFPAVPVLIDEIRRERRIELVLEGFRFDDLLRWKAGKLIENPETIVGIKLHANVKAQYPATSPARNLTLDANGYVRVYTNLAARVWADKLYLFPLPAQELLLNPKLAPQNSGW